MIARLKPGATLAQAQTQIDAQNATLEADDPMAKMLADAGFRSLAAPLHADYVASIRPALLLLQSGAITHLLIGAVNCFQDLSARRQSEKEQLQLREDLHRYCGLTEFLLFFGGGMTPILGSRLRTRRTIFFATVSKASFDSRR